MPLDASIYSQIRRPQMPNPLEQYGQALQIKNLMDQQETSGLQRQKIEREFAREGQLRDLVAASGGDRKMLIGNLVKGGFLDEAGKLEESDRKVRKDEADIAKTGGEQKKIDLEFRLKNFDIVDQNLNSATDQGSYEVALERIKARLGPDALANIDPQFDPARIAAARQQSLPIKEQLEQQWKALDFNYRQGNDAANRATTTRGQDLTAATATRGQDKDIGAWSEPYLADGVSVQKNKRTGEIQPVSRGGTTVNVDTEKLSPGYRRTADGNQEIIPGGPADKPTESQQKQLVGVKNLNDAITEYRTALSGFGTMDLINPDSRARMGTKYNNMMLQAKEAFNLGVLNGPDFQILQSVITDPRSVTGAVTSKSALDDQASELARIMSKVGEVAAQGPGSSRQARPAPAPAQPQAAATAAQPSAAPRTFNAMPDPAQFTGKIARDPQTGEKYLSDGKRWMRQ